MPYGIEIAALGRRDHWTCWVCAGDVDPDAVPGSPHAASVDHVIPRARGGTNDPANLRLAHRRCNGQRGSAVPELDWPDRFAVFEPAPLWTTALRCQRRPGDWEAVGFVAADDAARATHWLEDALTSIFAAPWETRTTALTSGEHPLATIGVRLQPEQTAPRHRGNPRRRRRA
jgi:hypothetical protein